MNFRCVQCGYHIKILYVQYSPGNIRLMKCKNCRAVADEYIECEIMILLIDLILHKAKAYRHLFYNMFDREAMNFEGLIWKSTFGFLLLDAYRISILSTNEEGWGSDPSLASLSWGCGKILLDTFLGNLSFIGILLLGTRSLLNMPVEVSGYKNILLAILASSYLKMFLIAMMVWEFPSSVIFIIDIFVLSSNTLALKVMSEESAMAKCFGVCFCAHVVKFLISLALNIHLPKLITRMLTL
ncbi:protein arv1 homolog isoform X1 [Cynara cardunculus var. scolymus]|uniref:protein arv1 homolog isoform X1 n=2 Tax=Cynara cardunculus var. scolymus TaxID=59895 RepID=UPI000D62D1F5|nr:protein arv1 homolog isoform X1 [Cynara cardunculus var. scolymus]XP_024979032.1 protein arv1 homolog isoform X1 [Cynara cardunculus var. scolymus]